MKKQTDTIKMTNKDEFDEFFPILIKQLASLFLKDNFEVEVYSEEIFENEEDYNAKEMKLNFTFKKEVENGN